MSEPKPALTTSPASPLPPTTAIDDDVAQIPSWRKWVILFVVCWMPLPMTFWSTAIMPATLEVASDLNIPVTTITTINAGVFVAQALSGLIWLPVTPLLGSIIATFTSWRVIYGAEAGMCLFGLILSLLFIPKASEVENPKLAETIRPRTAKEILRTFNPMHVFCQFKYPKVILANIACGLLGFNQYGILSSIRRVINPRFNLTSPLSSGLFYLAPGAGFLVGSTVGGKISDVVVKRYMRKRNGQRIPEDRLNSSLVSVLIILPLGTLLYGWSVYHRLGGMALPIISAFIEGFGLMASFSGLNTYAAEVRPAHRTAVITGKYVIQYSFGAMSVGGVVPMIDGIGVGWAFTVITCFSILAGVLVLLIARFSKNWKA
ncbi:major facilitator superfamily transporter [Fusarium bulbicola]|nr:major facilitator superfamily transporter [Fusarium bulbicola]